jgi:transposase-like protein
MLREAEVELSKGQTVVQVSRKLGITDQTYYRWRKEYGGMKIDQAKRLKELEVENGKLKKLVADLSLDKEILKEVASKNF